MASATGIIDNEGRVTLPQAVLDSTGITPGAKVVIEASNGHIVIRPKQLPPITARIAAMELPMGDWEAVENESARGSS